MAFNYLSGEPITGLDEGRPLFLRTPDSTFNLATFMRTQLYAALATLRIGMDVLTKDENVRLDTMFAHGGLFTTKGVAQRFLAAAIDTPVAVGDTAAEGGAWGMAVLAAFLVHRTPGQSLADYLTTRCSPTPNSKRSSLTPPTLAASTPSCSATSRPCLSSRRPSNTPEPRQRSRVGTRQLTIGRTPPPFDPQGPTIRRTEGKSGRYQPRKGRTGTPETSVA